jgi:hypothetical protein
VVARFGFSVAGEQQIDRGFQRLVDSVEDLRPAWPDIADDFLEMEARQFDTQGGSGSGGWTPLSARYARRKAVVAPGATILVLSGRMRRSLTQAGGEHVRREERHELTLGTTVRSAEGAPYPLFHQKGTSRMPMRKPIELAESDRRRWTRLLHRYAVGAIASAFRAGRRPSVVGAARGIGPNPRIPL